MKQMDVLGVPVSVSTVEELLDEIRIYIKENRKLTIAAINARKVVRAHNDPKFFKMLKTFDLFLPDGVSIIRALPCSVQRITGVDLMEEICAHCEELHASIFLYGASKESNSIAAINLRKKYPNIDIAGCCDGYHDERVIEAINASEANVVFIAKGTPAQETWIKDNLQKTNANVYLGVGGAFDIYSGLKKRSPKWIQDLGFEWLYRMLKEPRRFTQIPQLLQFSYLITKEKRQKKRMSQYYE